MKAIGYDFEYDEYHRWETPILWLVYLFQVLRHFIESWIFQFCTFVPGIFQVLRHFISFEKLYFLCHRGFSFLILKSTRVWMYSYKILCGWFLREFLSYICLHVNITMYYLWHRDIVCGRWEKIVLHIIFWR